MPLNLIFDHWKVVWQPNVCPKMSTCFLRTLYNKLLSPHKGHHARTKHCTTWHLFYMHKWAWIQSSSSFQLWLLHLVTFQAETGFRSYFHSLFADECKLMREKFKGKAKYVVLAKWSWKLNFGTFGRKETQEFSAQKQSLLRNWYALIPIVVTPRIDVSGTWQYE